MQSSRKRSSGCFSNTGQGSFLDPSLDLYGYDPSYELATFKTWAGVALSKLTMVALLFYVGFTAHDFVTRPPELVANQKIELPDSVGTMLFDVPDISVSMAYSIVTHDENRTTIVSNKTYLDAKNTDRHFRYSFSHRTIQEQDRRPRTIVDIPSIESVVGNVGHELCPDKSKLSGNYVLEGDYTKPKYQYLQLRVEKCLDSPECAPLDETNAILDSGEAQIKIYLKTQLFDVNTFHKTGNGVFDNLASWRLWGMNRVEQRYEMIFQPFFITEDERFAGSPPLPQKFTTFLGFNHLETIMQPRTDDLPDIGTWYFRLDNSVHVENITYWSRSLFDLFAMWGAMASFLFQLSFGLVARVYNKWKFHKYFVKSSGKMKDEAESKITTAMNLIAPGGKRSAELYKAIRSQFDLMIVQPDVRLFDAHHFDNVGRMIATPEELRFPSTAYGHVRKFANAQFMMEYRAATIISRWYARSLHERSRIPISNRRLQLSSKELSRQLPITFSRSFSKENNGSYSRPTILPSRSSRPDLPTLKSKEKKKRIWNDTRQLRYSTLKPPQPPKFFRFSSRKKIDADSHGTDVESSSMFFPYRDNQSLQYASRCNASDVLELSEMGIKRASWPSSSSVESYLC